MCKVHVFLYIYLQLHGFILQQERGISHTEIVAKKGQQEFASGYRSCTSSLAHNDSFIEDGHIINLRSCKKEKSLDRSTISSLSMKPAFVEDESCILEHSRKLCNPKFNEPGMSACIVFFFFWIIELNHVLNFCGLANQDSLHF